MHVDDCCKCIIKSTFLNKYIGPINVVSNQEISIFDLISILIKISKKDIEIIVNETNIEKRDLLFSNQKMKTYLCNESINLKKGLMQEFQYFKSINGDKENG
jgi:nucleoside-diphosphate-sugar epimerase